MKPKKVIAVAAGKGGVGKSTTAVNIALQLKEKGYQVGLLDADIYGPSITTMFGIESPKEPPASSSSEAVVKHGIKIFSMGLLSPRDAPHVLRGPIIANIAKQMLTQVNWDGCDFLIIDFPPGTGDVPLTLAQTGLINGVVCVTTPQQVSETDVHKALKMFQTLQVPIIGLVENMSYFLCPNCTTKHEIFPGNCAQRLSEDFQIPLLGRLPLDPNIARFCDEDASKILLDKKSMIFKEYESITENMLGFFDDGKKKPSGLFNFKLKWRKEN